MLAQTLDRVTSLGPFVIGGINLGLSFSDHAALRGDL